MGKELKIYPNGGINNIKIGWTLYEVINTLAKSGDDDGLEFKFSDTLKFIIVYSKEKDINLIFESFSQRLIMIEIKLGQSLGNEFKYKNESIDKFNFKLIYNRYFGPTCEGHFDDTKGFYFLSYCGITFKFNNISVSSVSNEILNTMNKDINCSSVFIYENTTDKDSNNFLWMNYSKLLSDTLKIKPSVKYLDALKDLIPSVNEIEEKNVTKIEYATYNYHSKEKIVLKFSNHHLFKECSIKFGTTTMQEMIRTFGLPDDTILKRKSRLNDIQMKKFKVKTTRDDGSFTFTSSRAYLPTSLISPRKNLKSLIGGIDHMNNSIENYNQETIKIHNYFRFGFDVIYDLNVTSNGSNVVSRVIAHQNNLKSTDFLKYEKLLMFYEDKDHNLETNLKLNEIDSILGLSKLRVFLDRKEYNIQEDFHFQIEHKDSDRIFEFVNIEEEEEEEENDDDSGNSDLKFWGLTNYDYCKGAIFEANCNDGEISTITLY